MNITADRCINQVRTIRYVVDGERGHVVFLLMQLMDLTISQPISGRGRLIVYGDWGPWEYGWTATGEEDFRAFLARIQPDYLYGKMTGGALKYDGPATLKALIELANSKGAFMDPGDVAEMQIELEQDYSDLKREREFERWLTESYWARELEANAREPERARKFKREPDAEHVFFELFPQLQKLLRLELDKGTDF